MLDNKGKLSGTDFKWQFQTLRKKYPLKSLWKFSFDKYFREISKLYIFQERRERDTEREGQRMRVKEKV